MIEETLSEAYLAVRERVAGIDGVTPDHHLLGHPQSLPGDMRRDAELVAAGIRRAGADACVGERAAGLLAKAPTECCLLLQLDSDDLPSFSWGILGRIYFWIRRGDLAPRAFEGVWARLQYT